MNRHTIIYFIAAILFLSSCQDDTDRWNGGGDFTLPIQIESTYPTQATTRASIENGFVAEDAVGIFVVDYEKVEGEWQANTPALKGDRAGNIKFSFDGSHWTANYQLYWKNSSTPADFYGYYPYDQSMQSVTDYAFSVSSQQNGDTEDGYLLSDLLWAKAEKVMPTTETIRLPYKHLMAGVNIMLERGTGFTPAEWANLDKTVQIENTILGGSVDLSTGSVTVGDGVSAPITPLAYNGNWRAVVFPQTVVSGKTIVSVTIDGQSYPLVKELATEYVSGKMHNMTVTVNKSTKTGDYELKLTADNLVAWVDDPMLHEGLTFDYTIVRVPAAGKLKETIDNMFDSYSDVKSVKFIGPMNSTDRTFIYEQLRNLQNVNMYEVEMEDSVLDCFHDHSTLQHFVYPQKGIKRIGWACFKGTNLTGPLVIPEGVEIVDGDAYEANFYGALTLPSTLKRMSNFMGDNDKLTGELHLPEGIEYVEAPRGNFSGSIYFPSSLKEVGGSWNYPNMTGTISIPSCMTEIPNFMFEGNGCSQVEFHDGVIEIGAQAFNGSKLQGELVLPPNLKKIHTNAFSSSKISKIIFNDGLRIIDDAAFRGCNYITGTMTYAPNVARIPKECFEGCSAMTGIVLPKNVELIEANAFRNCYSLNSIICENPEPPVVYEDAFLGVPKDNFTVEVPKGAVEKYREAPGWREFKRIAEYSNFVCRPMQANALNTAHTEQLVLNADGAWEVERKPDWVTLSKTSGTGKAELTLTFHQMTHGTGNRSDSIIFVMPQAGYRTGCAVSQYDYDQEEDSYIALQTHTKGRGIDIVFVGDGYDGEDISNGNYLNLVREQTEYFFGLEPYKSHRDYFNVYVTFPLSQEKGVNTMNTYVNNHFGTLYGYIGYGSNNQLLTEDDEIRSYILAHTPVTQDNLGRTLIILVPNSDAYGGVTYDTWYGSHISICPPSSRPYPQDTRGVVQHEAGGHGFGWLGDEEIIYSAWPLPSEKTEIQNKQREGWYANISTVSGLHSVPWADFVFDPRYSDQVDVFEGGFGYMRGIFRPEQNSCMNYGIPYYNAPSRLSIMRRIMDYAGEPFSMEYFYAQDSKEWGSTNNTKTRSVVADMTGSSYAGSNLHRAPQKIAGKKMSNQVRQIRKGLKAKLTNRR